MTSTWRSAAIACALSLPVACGGGTPETTRDAVPAAAPASETTASAATNDDPCAMAPLAEWESATGHSGLTHSRDGANTCDVLDDANGRVAGSVSRISASLYDGTVERMQGEAVAEVGDEAYWVTMGPGMLYVKQGDRALSVMVNPSGTTDHRAAAVRLAKVALVQ